MPAVALLFAATLSAVLTAADARAQIVPPQPEPAFEQALSRIWRAVTRDAAIGIEPADDGAEAVESTDAFFRLKAPRGGVDWGMPAPPLRLTGFVARRSTRASVDTAGVGLTPDQPLRLHPARDICLVDASARAEPEAATWQPLFDCALLNALRVRLNADLMYDRKSERVTTPLGVSVAQVFKVGPHAAAELSAAVRAHLDKLEAKGYDWNYRAMIRLPFPE